MNILVGEIHNMCFLRKFWIVITVAVFYGLQKSCLRQVKTVAVVPNVHVAVSVFKFFNKLLFLIINVGSI